MSVEKIEDGVVVSMTYLLVVDGEEAGRAGEDEPLEYLHGADNIVPGLEAALVGKKVGDRVQVSVSPEDAYGDYDDEEMDEFSMDEIPGSENLELGMIVEVEDDEITGHVTPSLAAASGLTQCGGRSRSCPGDQSVV